LVALAFLATPSLAQKVNIDYAHDFDFDTVKTFQYVETKDTDAGNELVAGRIKDAIIRELTEGGLEQVESDPDLYVTYHVATKDNTVFNTTSFGYGGYGAGWGAWGMHGGIGMGSSTTTTSTYTEGTLVIDAYEPAEKKMVWRGMGTVTVASKPEKQTKQIDSILKKMGSKWQKILAKQGE
jgi:L-aminopeptidase/D-esterase-like protein